MFSIYRLLAVLTFAIFATNATATPIITFDESSGTSAFNNRQNVGWRFDVLDPINVAALGWYDEGLDGLGAEHQVGIWDATGNLLVSALVPGGAIAGLDDVYRRVNISELHLDVGRGYIVGGLNVDDSIDRLASNVDQVVDSSIRFVSATFSLPTTNLERPTLSSTAASGFYGPMFFVANVPLPSTILLLMVGIVGLGASRKRPGFDLG